MKFSIAELERNTDGGVISAHWTVNKTSGDNTASAYGSCSFVPDSTNEGYIPYAELTEASVIEWVKGGVIDLEALEAALDADLAEQASPTILTGTPW